MSFDEFAEAMLKVYDTDGDLTNEDPSDNFVLCPECGEPLFHGDEGRVCPICEMEFDI